MKIKDPMNLPIIIDNPKVVLTLYVSRLIPTDGKDEKKYLSLDQICEKTLLSLDINFRNE